MAKHKPIRYKGENAEVTWDGRLCIHFGECGRAEGDLFVGGRKPWCSPELADQEQIRDVVLRCPTGALAAQTNDGEPLVPDAEPNEVTVSANGPLYVKGNLEIMEASEDSPGTRYRAALCRCGESRNKPFCDLSHVKAGFEDSGAVGVSQDMPEDSAGPLSVRGAPNGPLLISGPLAIRASSGRVAWRGNRAALCRCGASANKPFCDGSHTSVGFTSTEES